MEEIEPTNNQKKNLIPIIIVIIIVAIPLVILADWVLVESSPVGRYYHYTYQIQIIPDNEEEYTILLPNIVYGDGTTAELMNEFIELGYSVEDSYFGTVLNITDRGEVLASSHEEYDATQESDDHTSDPDPSYSTWEDELPPNEDFYYGATGTVWIFSDTQDIEITLWFSSWYKYWYVREGLLHNGYKRGGQGYSIDGEGISENGWFLLNITGGDIEVE